QMRLHPAESRITRLAGEIPATYVAFDLLALGDRDLQPAPFAERRQLLEGAVAGGHERVRLTPVTDDPDVAEDWFRRFEGAGFGSASTTAPGACTTSASRPPSPPRCAGSCSPRSSRCERARWTTPPGGRGPRRPRTSGPPACRAG